MKAQPTRLITTAAAVWMVALANPQPAFSETPARRNVIELLDETKLIDYEQRIGAKKVEMDRLNEDLKKGTDEIEAIEKRIQKVTTATEEATKLLEHFNAQKKRAALELDLLNLRIDAERLKGDGLRLLQVANKLAQDAISRRNDETSARTALVAAETRHLANRAPATAEPDAGPAKAIVKNDPPLTDWRKKLEKSERATALAESAAGKALAIATSKLREADNAAAKAEKKQEEVALDKTPSFPGGNDPLTPPAPATAEPAKVAKPLAPAEPVVTQKP